jgi:hypothetical protein
MTMEMIDYVLVNRTSGEVEVSGSCAAHDVQAQPLADHQLRVIGKGTWATHYQAPTGLTAYTPEQRQAKASPQPHCTWDNHRMGWVDVRPFHQLQADRWAQIKVDRAAAMDAPIDTPFGRFDADPHSRAVLAVAQAPVPWTLADNTVVDLDAQSLTEVRRLIGQRLHACHVQGRELRARIASATTTKDLEAIEWPP